MEDLRSSNNPFLNLNFSELLKYNSLDPDNYSSTHYEIPLKFILDTLDENDFLARINSVWPEFIENCHLKAYRGMSNPMFKENAGVIDADKLPIGSAIIIEVMADEDAIYVPLIWGIPSISAFQNDSGQLMSVSITEDVPNLYKQKLPCYWSKDGCKESDACTSGCESKLVESAEWGSGLVCLCRGRG